MKRLNLFFLLLLTVCLWPGKARADCSYTGGFTISGTMGEGIEFAIHVAYWGDDPCLLVGETWYKRKNGSVSKIKVRGWLNEEACFLREEVDGRFCGLFDVTGMPSVDELEPDNFNKVEGRKLGGYWSYGAKTYEFKDVKLSREQGYAVEDLNIDYEGYLHFCDDNDFKKSGEYGFYDISNGTGDTLYSTITVLVDTDSIYWTSSDYNEVGGWDVRATTPGVKVKKGVKTTEGSFEPTVDGRTFKVIFMDDMMHVVYGDTPGAGFEESESDFDIDLYGVYTKRADRYIVNRMRKANDKVEDAEHTFSADLQIPRTDSQRLNDSIHVWVSKCLGMGEDKKTDYWTLAETSGDVFLSDRCYDPEWDGEDDYPYYQLCFQSLSVNYGNLNARKYINMNASLTTHEGGIHPFTVSFSNTFRRSDGKVMRWRDWFVQPDRIRPIVEKYMREQNPETQFFPEVLPLPEADPTFAEGNFFFGYQQYEVAPYSDGFPFCSIPASVLMPYMTEGAKKLVK